jgi:molybdate transport system permease protein
MLSPTVLETDALLLSLRVAFWSMLVSLPFALLVAWALARRRFPGHAVLNGLVHLPLILPPVVIGYLLLLLFGRHGPLGAVLEAWFDAALVFRWEGAALASAVMGFPLLVWPIRQSFEAVDRRLEQAARTLGAGPFDRFFAITLPLILPGVLGGMVLAFGRGLGEFGATITFVGSIPGETTTLPLALFTATQAPGGDQSALRMMILSILVAFAALLMSEWFARYLARRLGAP